MRKLTVLATLGLIALVSVSVLLFSLGTIGTAHAARNQCSSQTGGTINGSIVAATGTGECRLDGVTVNGHVTVGHSGVQLILVNGSVIKGGIKSPGGEVQISDSTVKGGVEVKDSVRTVFLKNSMVNGHVIFEGNENVDVSDNTIKGSLTLKDNTGTVTESGNTVSGKTKITP